MRMFLLTLTFAVMAGAATAQPPSTFSRALPPTQESLDRLNLKSAWSLYVPTSGQADGLAHVQVLD